jgi:type II pantothenate kinase
MKAVGLGALKLSGKKKALVVNMGTGTTLVTASDDKKIEHIGGTAVGGGTIEGLGKRMLGKNGFKDLEEMANMGDTNNIDLTVADVEGGPVGMLPQDATASNFKKLDVDSDENDVAAAIFNMVSQVIGVVASMAARAYHLEEDIVFVGNLIQSKRIADCIENVMKLFHMKFCIPVNGGFCAAIGAAESIM